MGTIRRFLRRLRLLTHRSAAEDSMDAEMRYHLECETADRIAEGMSPEAARISALRDFGGVERFKEEARDARGIRPVEDAVRDLGYAARLLRRNPGFTSAVALTFGLGIGATTAIFSVVYGVLLRPLPYAAPERLVALWERNLPRNRDQNVVSLENFDAWRGRAGAFSGMAALVPRSVTLPGDGAPERIPGAEVSREYFSLLGVAPAAGRNFAPDDRAAVILSHRFWQQRLAGDPAVVGRSLAIAGAPHLIAGVMPAGFEPPQFGWLGRQELWFPLIDTPEKRAWGRFLLVVARLHPDVTLEAARAELAAIARTRERESAANSGWSASVVPLKEQITGDARLPLLAALAGVTVLLALAVVNVGTLTLAFMRRRRHELSIRRAIGATDGRLFRQLFTQSVLVGTAGAAIGLLAAVPGLSGLVAVLPPELPRASSIALDRPVLLTCTGVAAIATMLFGTGCALRGRSSRQAGVGRNVPGTRRSDRLSGGTLVATEIALGLALAIVALLMTRSFGSLRSVDLGFDSTGVVAARVALSPRYDTPDRRRGFFDALLERLRATPGVTEAGLISTRPFGGESVSTTAHDGDAPEPAVAERLSADVRYVDSGFFRTLRIPLVTGEAFEEEPAATAPPSVVINERLARSIWAERNPVGRRLRISLFGTITGRVVGVARDVHLLDARTPPRPTLYLSDRRFPSDARDILVRADGDPDAIIPSLRAALAAVDPVLPLYQVAVMPRTVNESLAADRFIAVLLAVFAASALLLAGVGIFGVFSSDVASRRREIAIRMALGAHETSVAMLMLRRALFRAIPGIAIGSVLAFVLARSMSSLLFGVEPGDPLIYLTAAAAVLLLVMLATLVPAWQALLRSPLSVLREG